jgi:hypothetical protein
MQPPKSITTHKNSTNKKPKQKQNLPQLTKPFSTCKGIPGKPTKQHSDQNPKGRKSGSMAYSQQNQKEGLQERREAKP